MVFFFDYDVNHDCRYLVHRPPIARWTTHTAEVRGGGSFKKGHGVDGSFICHRLEL